MEIIYEDNHLLAINKQVGEIVQGDKTGDNPLSNQVKIYLKTKYNKPGNVFLGVVHRLDRPVSGALLFARTSKALTRLNEIIKNRQIKKIYWAVVKNPPPTNSATLIHYLTRDPQKNISHALNKAVPNSQKAILSYQIINHFNGFYCLKIDLQTGRHHQIRAQLAQIGCPIVGDLKYGYPYADQNKGIHLHCRQLTFKHPITQKIVEIVALPPADFLWQGFTVYNP